MSWTIERPTLPGFYWFSGSAPAGQYRARGVVLATVVELTGVPPNIKVWFPQKDMPIPVSECEGQWVGPLEVPR
jgi:hypothetical protein